MLGSFKNILQWQTYALWVTFQHYYGASPVIWNILMAYVSYVFYRAFGWKTGTCSPKQVRNKDGSHYRLKSE